MSSTVTSAAGSSAIGRRGAWVLGNRALMRAPIRLYQARLGFLFGSRTLMLEHVGRKSGARRLVVLEVVGHPAPDTYVVASGFGERAQWFRNLIANPQVRVSIAGHGPRAATARRLPAAEADAALADYMSRHPRAWAKFKNVLEHTLGTAISERNTPLPMVELRLDRPRSLGARTAPANASRINGAPRSGQWRLSDRLQAQARRWSRSMAGREPAADPAGAGERRWRPARSAWSYSPGDRGPPAAWTSGLALAAFVAAARSPRPVRAHLAS